MRSSVKRKHVPLRGFSLIELVVSLVVIGIVYGMLFANLPRTNSRVEFQSQVSTVRSMILSAQIFGASQGGEAQGRGVVIRVSDQPDSNTQKVTEFLDRSSSELDELGIRRSNRVYHTENPSDQIVTEYILPAYIAVNNIYVGSSGTPLPTGCLSIAFVRPSTNANLSECKTFVDAVSDNYDSVNIEFQSMAVDGLYSCITILKIGQVSVKEGEC